jgi:hypothetical protein
VPTTLARNLWFGRDHRIAPSRVAFERRQVYVSTTLSELQKRFGFQLVRPDLRLCDDSQCRIGVAGRALYVDDNHLSAAGALELRSLFDPVFASETDEQ